MYDGLVGYPTNPSYIYSSVRAHLISTIYIHATEDNTHLIM